MKKVLISGYYNEKVHRVRCVRCSCIFEYEDSDIYENATYSPYSTLYNINFLVDCPECGWSAPALTRPQ